MSRLNRIFDSDTFVLMPESRTFTRGLADILDVSDISERYATSETTKEADTKAIAADWRAVGKDLEIAYEWGRKEFTK